MFNVFITVLLSLLMVSCSDGEPSGYKDVKVQNQKGEFIYRYNDEQFFDEPSPQEQEREEYPWEGSFIGAHPRITKDFFR